jgi:DNA-binding NarL/FixJ family response regulator
MDEPVQGLVRVFVIEDHPVIVYGLKSLFRPGREGVEIAGNAGSVDEAIRCADPASFDVFIFDLWLSETDPVENAEKLKLRFPSKPILVYTSEESGLWIRRMFAAGVSGYIFKSAERAEIRRALEQVARGGMTFPGVVNPGDDMMNDAEFRRKNRFIQGHHREMLLLMSKGKTQKFIADQNNLSVSTVEKIFQNLREKFGAVNNTDLIRILKDEGLI